MNVEKGADMKSAMNAHFISTIVVLNIVYRISYGIHLHDDKFLEKENSKQHSTKIGLIEGDVPLTQNTFTNPANTFIGEADVHQDHKLTNAANLAQLNLGNTPKASENVAAINLDEQDSDLTESNEEMAGRLGSSIELMKGQLFIQPGYHVIDVHKEINSDFENPDSELSTSVPSISSVPEVTATTDSVGEMNIDQPKITEATPKKTNALASISIDSLKAKADLELKNTAQIIIKKELEEYASRPAVDEPTVQPSSFADCTSGVHESIDGKIPSIGLEESSSEKIYHKMSSNLMESTNVVSDVSSPGGVQLIVDPKDVSFSAPPENPAIVGQKEFVMANTDNDAAMSAEEGAASLSLDAARSLASNIMTLLIRYNERQCAPGEQKCLRAEQSEQSESINNTEYQQVILSDTLKEDSAKKVDPANEKSVGMVNVSDEKSVRQQSEKKGKELSLFEKIILGIRCARQDCRGVLNSHQDSTNRSSQQQRKRRPISTNWTIMRMKRFRHQILDDRRKRGGHVGTSVAGAKKIQERTDNILNHVPKSEDLIIDVSHLLNALTSCECQLSRRQRNFLRRMMLDDVGRVRVIETIKNFINKTR